MLTEYTMEDDDKPKKRYHMMVLDPNYQPGTLSKKTEKHWGNVYNKCNAEFECKFLISHIKV